MARPAQPYPPRPPYGPGSQYPQGQYPQPQYQQGYYPQQQYPQQQYQQQPQYFTSATDGVQDGPQKAPTGATVHWPRLASEAQFLMRPRGKPGTQAAAEKFSATYRRGATELARLKAFSPNRSLREMAESAVALANLSIYRRDRVTIMSVFKGVAFGLPDNFRKLWHYHATAFAITMVTAAIAFFAVLADPANFYMFVDRKLAGGRGPEASREYLAETLGGDNSALSENVAFSFFLFQHNTRVAFLCYATGILMGLPTLLLLAMNGLMLGAFIALFYRVGLTVELLAWLLPHGVPEIGAIILCGGAGLALGHRMLSPGNRPRGEVLVETAQSASITAVACAPLLLLAGFIEGVFRQSDASTATRYALFGFLLAGMLAWLLFVRERIKRREAFSLAG